MEESLEWISKPKAKSNEVLGMERVLDRPGLKEIFAEGRGKV